MWKLPENNLFASFALLEKSHCNWELIGIVYRYTWSNCKVTCYGKTYYRFFTRASEQMRISNLTQKRLESVEKSATSDQLLKCNFSIDFDHFYILASDPNKFRLLIKESLLIKQGKDAIRNCPRISLVILSEFRRIG